MKLLHWGIFVKCVFNMTLSDNSVNIVVWADQLGFESWLEQPTQTSSGTYQASGYQGIKVGGAWCWPRSSAMIKALTYHHDMVLKYMIILPFLRVSHSVMEITYLGLGSMWCSSPKLICFIVCDRSLGAEGRARVWWRYQPNLTADTDPAG
jgi:hypothetical protein